MDRQTWMLLESPGKPVTNLFNSILEGTLLLASFSTCNESLVASLKVQKFERKVSKI